MPPTILHPIITVGLLFAAISCGSVAPATGNAAINDSGASLSDGQGGGGGGSTGAGNGGKAGSNMGGNAGDALQVDGGGGDSSGGNAGTGAIVLRGGIGTQGPLAAPPGSIRLVNQRIAVPNGQSCGASVCISGGIAP